MDRVSELSNIRKMLDDENEVTNAYVNWDIQTAMNHAPAVWR
jgi:hypothetical protein